MLILCDVEQLVLVDSRRRTLSLELEDHNTSVMARREQVHLGVCSDNPESIKIALKGLNGCTLVEIPYANRLILADGKDEVLVWVEQSSGGILEMAAASIDFPRLSITHPPELNQPVVTG